MGSETEGGNGKPVFVESSLTLINEARGCPKPASDDEGCRLKLSTPAFTHSSREAMAAISTAPTTPVTRVLSARTVRWSIATSSPKSSRAIAST